MKRILVQVYCAKNLGDDLFLKVLFDRYPNIEFHILHADKEYMKIFSDYNVKNITFISPKFAYIYKKFINYKKYDALINIGGSIFMQIPKWEKQIKERENLVKIFEKLNKPTFILGANFGPYYDKGFIEKYKLLFQKYTDICFRDSNSYDLFKNLENVRLAPDIVFGLKNDINTKIKNSVGLSLINIENRDDLKKYNDVYIERIVMLIEEYAKLGYSINLFSFCKQEGDELIIQKVLSKIKKNLTSNVNTVYYEGNINEFLGKFKSMECIIGTRFHSVILSQVFGQSIYPIIYSDKTHHVLKDLDLDKEYIYIKDIDKLDVSHVVNINKNNLLTDKTIFKESEQHFKELDKYIYNT